MTELLYQTDAYLKEFDAVVSGHDEEKHGVLLDRTAFYPGGGGQPADFGELRVGDDGLPAGESRAGQRPRDRGGCRLARQSARQCAASSTGSGAIN